MSTTVVFLFTNSPPGESTAAAIPTPSLETDADSPLSSPKPVPALLVLQDLLTPDVWCTTGGVTVLYGTGEGGPEGGPSTLWGGGSTKVASALFALA